MKTFSEIERETRQAYNNDPIFRVMWDSGKPMHEMVLELLRKVREQRCRIEELESIAPKRIEAPDGKVYVWHCPNELIPTTKIDA